MQGLTAGEAITPQTPTRKGLNANIMKKEFVTYEIARKLKELGFDESCFGFYGTWNNHDEFSMNPDEEHPHSLDAPLWQQVETWLRESHKINVFVQHNPQNGKYCGSISIFNGGGHNDVGMNTGRFVQIKPSDNYEQVREAAIFEALELITK